MAVIPKAWLSPVKMERVIIHWTAGKHKASANDKDHYHILIEDDGKVVRGNPVISGNARVGAKGKKASHTLNCNTGSIGVSLCCMGNAVKKPFNSGQWPMTEKQWDKMITVVAELAAAYSIAIGPKTILTHAEVEDNLNIKQRGKWDITRLAFDLSIDGARPVGELLRGEAKGKKDATAEIVSLLSTRKPAKLGGEADGEIDEEDAEQPQPIAEIETVPLVQAVDPVLMEQQKILFDKGYTEVGPADGRMGPFTKQAIERFRKENGLPDRDVIDDEFIAALAKKSDRADISAERALAPTSTVHREVPEVKKHWWNKLVGWVVGIPAAIGGLFSKASEQFDATREWFSPLRKLFGSVDPVVWVVAGGVVAIVIAIIATRGEKQGVENYREGRTR